MVGKHSDFSEPFAGFQQSFNVLYQHVAENMASLVQAIEQLASLLRALANADGSMLLSRVSTTVTQLRSSLQQRWRNATSGLQTLQAQLVESEGAGNDLTRCLGQQKLLTRRLRLTAINASVAACRVGKQAAGFAAITDALIRMSDRQATGLMLMLQEAGRLGEQTAKITEVRRQIDLYAGPVLDAASTTTREDPVETASAILEGMADAVGQTDGATEDVRGIMREIQHRDVLRRALEHVQLVLDATADCAATLEQASDSLGPGVIPSEELAEAAVFLQEAVTLSTQVIHHTAAEMRHLLQHVQHMLGAVAAVAAFLRSIPETLGDNTDGHDAMERVVELMDQLLIALREVARVSTGAIPQDISLDVFEEHLHTLREDLATLRAMRVLLRVEAARTPELAAHGVVDAIDRVTLQFDTAVAEQQRAKDCALRLRLALEESRWMTQGLIALQDNHAEHQSLLQKAMSSFSQAASRAAQVGARLHQLTDEMIQRMDALAAELLTDLDLARGYADTLAIAQRVLQALPDRGADTRRHIRSGRLQDLIVRFAMFADTEIAGRTMGSDQVDTTREHADAGGEFTLF